MVDSFLTVNWSQPLLYFRSLGSTQDTLLAINATAPERTVVVCDRQGAGRGQQGRIWVAPDGKALTFSYLARHISSCLQLLPVSITVALCDAVDKTIDCRCEIKRPNDIIVGSKKLAGILIQANSQQDWAVIGVGLNVNVTAGDLEDELWQKATSAFAITGKHQSRAQFLSACLEAIDLRLDQARRGDTAAIEAAFANREVTFSS